MSNAELLMSCGKKETKITENGAARATQNGSELLLSCDKKAHKQNQDHQSGRESLYDAQ
jgi:hypothetical protein